MGSPGPEPAAGAALAARSGTGTGLSSGSAACMRPLPAAGCPIGSWIGESTSPGSPEESERSNPLGCPAAGRWAPRGAR
eukprot:195673-Lingulodinium_polyedra.AAC.1